MFLDFLKSLVIPKHMDKHRYMSILFPILIFGLTIVVLVIPFRTNLKNSRDELVLDETLNVIGFYELENPEFDYNQIKAGGYKVENGEMKTSLENDKTYKQYVVSYQDEDDKTINVHIILDPYSNRDRAIEETLSAYDKIYNVENNASQEALKKRDFVALLTYVEKVKDPELDLDTKIKELQGLSLEVLDKRYKDLTYFDYYNITATPEVDDYLIIFNKGYFEYQTPIYNESKELKTLTETRISIIYHEKFMFNINEIDNISEFGQKIAYDRVDVQMMLVEQQYIIGTAVVILFYTLIIVIIFWLFFKKRGTLKKFKEYYNIAGIASIIPTIISFGVLWLFPDAITLYGVIFSIFYVFVLYRINKLESIDSISIK